MMSGYQGKPRSLSFDNSGVLLATGGSERVTVWSFDGEGPEGTAPESWNYMSSLLRASHSRHAGCV